MNLQQLTDRLRAASQNPPKAPTIKINNPGGQRNRMTALSQARAVAQAQKQIADEARARITG